MSKSDINQFNHKERGFTLVELLVAIAIFATIMAIAVPGVRGFITGARMNAQPSDIVGAINLARSEAVKRNSGVTICKSADGATCVAGGNNWAVGWIVFADPDYNGVVNAGETVIRAYPILSGNTTAVGSGGVTQGITFSGMGRSLPTFVGGKITMCPAAGTDQSYCRTVCVNSQGRPRVDTPTELAADTYCGN
ncbi:GspH/FimT family pseudopilin [Undibacterium sp. Ji83W]|uniref:GspH/FimT family pseudopilin n=1 Tax=Undibacterium sp. Ji83W TaxID=3413043 RepID=UPI003BF2E37A